jgi:protein phosphatase
MRFVGAMQSHVGHIRDSNEDCAAWVACVASGAGGALLIVADGMGGHAAGEVASRIAIETVSSSDAPLPDRVTDANRAVLEAAEQRPERFGMGTTLTVGEFRPDGTLEVGHIGDSRLYLFRRSALLQVTTDHSLVAEYLAAGAISPEEAATHPRRNVITRALGIDQEITVDSHTVHLRLGDRVLICSDGLTSMLPDDEIAAILQAQPAPQAAGWALIEAANQAGGEDNITVAIVDVSE